MNGEIDPNNVGVMFQVGEGFDKLEDFLFISTDGLSDSTLECYAIGTNFVELTEKSSIVDFVLRF
jgi:hypothetical protein